MNTALLSVEVVVYEFNLLHGKSFYFSKSPVNCDVEDVEPVSLGMAFVDVIFWIIYDREKEIKSVGGSEFAFEEKGISLYGSGRLISNVISAMSSIALIIVELRVIRYQ